MEKPKSDLSMTASTHGNAGLYMTFITSMLRDIGVGEGARKRISQQSRELQVSEPEIVAAWLNEMSELHS
jgi:hypothetical protein